MDKQKASKEIAKLLNEADDLIQKAVNLSEQSGVEFTLPWGGEGSYQSGMGATYYPTGHADIKDDSWYSVNQGWNPSAQSC